MVLMVAGYFSFLPVSSFSAEEEEAIMVSEKNLSMMPCKYLHKRIVTEGAFLDVSTSLLDTRFYDKGTEFDARSYINFRTVDEQMFTYFIHQSKADILSALKTGDRIVITGTITSCADKRPWIKVDSVIRATEK